MAYKINPFTTNFDYYESGDTIESLSDVAYPTTRAKGDILEYDGTRWVNKGIVYTIELIDNLSVDFYAPYDLKINSISNVLGVPTVTILDDGAAYTLTNTILSGSIITINVTVASVLNLNISKA